jgi:Fe-S cluster biogenesis protein NfuA
MARGRASRPVVAGVPEFRTLVANADDRVLPSAGVPSRAEIEGFLDAELRPFLHEDGADCVVTDVTDRGAVRLVLTGSLAQCPAAARTMTRALTPELTERFPDITGVLVE